MFDIVPLVQFTASATFEASIRPRDFRFKAKASGKIWSVKSFGPAAAKHDFGF